MPLDTKLRPGRRPRARTRTAFRAAATLPGEPTRVAILAAACEARQRMPATDEATAASEDRARVWDWDARVETSLYALVAYLYRRGRSEKWAGPGGSGRYACSISQLVVGLAPQLRWTGTREQLVRTHRHSVQRWLDWLQLAGLVTHCPQQDTEDWWWRTIITLHPLPGLDVEVVRAARDRLSTWPKDERRRRRLGGGRPRGRRVRDLSLIVDAARLRRAERRRRAVARRRRALADTRRRQAQANAVCSEVLLPQPYGVLSASSPAGEPSTAVKDANAATVDSKASQSESRLPTRTREGDAGDDSRSVLTPSAPEGLQAGERQSLRMTGPDPDGAPVEAPETLSERLAGAARRVAERRWLFELKEVQAEDRALEVGSWTLAREWPVDRLREAWVVARHGPGEAALHGPSRAGRLVLEHTAGDVDGGHGPRAPRHDYLNLRRAVARYERHYPAAVELVPGYPAGGLAALLHLGAAARELPDAEGPGTLAYAIGALAILSRRMKAHATHADPGRHRGQVARARARRAKVAAWGWAGADATNWPAWVQLADDGLPAIRLTARYQHELVVVDPGFGPAPSDVMQREVLRDTMLLRHGRVDDVLDGRTQMALRHRGDLEPQIRLADIDPRILELNRLTGAGLEHLLTLSLRYDHPVAEGLEPEIPRLLEQARARRRRQRQWAADHPDHDRVDERQDDSLPPTNGR